MEVGTKPPERLSYLGIFIAYTKDTKNTSKATKCSNPVPVE